MPVIKSAKKKLRQDKKREKINDFLRDQLKGAIKGAQKAKSSDKVKAAVILIDKAVNKHLIHKNKAARLKSRLSKVSKPTVKAATKTAPKTKSVKTTPKKKTAKK